MLIGLDIGGTKSAAVLGTADGKVLHRLQVPTPPGDWQSSVAILVKTIHRVLAAANCRVSDAQALGVSCGGPLDPETGIVHRPPNLPNWDNVPLRAILESEFGLPVTIENDANATALAEHRWGAGIGTRSMAFLTVGTGIGAGLILDGRLYRGRNGLSGEIGHATLLPNGPSCLCGKRGCLEALASGTAIGRAGREAYGNPVITSEIVCERARAGDAVALNILETAAYWLGIGLSNLLHTLNLERIILGTLAVAAGDLLLPTVRKTVDEHCWPLIRDGVKIVPAGLGDGAQDLAALAVAAGSGGGRRANVL